MILSLEDRKDFIRKYRVYLDRYMKFCLSSLSEKRMPDLELALDDQSYTNHKIIHIGIGKIPAESEEELMRWTMFLIGHECQHCLSTTQKAWKFGLDHGFKEVCTEISSSLEPRARRFSDKASYDRFFHDMKAKGYNLSESALRRFVHFIVNSLEDGRIERIRCIKRPRFKNYVVSVRGKEWNLEPVDDTLASDLDNPRAYLSIILNQILTLSTMSIYQKNFISVAGKDIHIHEILQECIPHVRKAVKSPSCRLCMMESIALCKILAMEIAEASKKTDLEELIENLIKSFVENQSFTADSRSEELGDSTEVRIFGMSDLTDEDAEKDGKGENGEDSSSGSTSSKGDSDKDSLPSGSPKGSHSGRDTESSLENAINDLMEEADASSEGEVQASINAGNINKNLVPKKDVEGDSDPAEIDLHEINGNYPEEIDFKENVRNYNPSSPYPVDLSAQGNVLKRKIERLFRNRITPSLRGQKRGRLDGRLLYKITMGEGEVFSKKQTSDEFDGCCYLLIDNSGSMGNGRESKRYYCCRAVSIIEHAFQDVMPVKIDAFDATGSNGVRHALIKNWTEKVSNNASWNFYTNMSSGWGNKDGYSIRVATEELLRRPEKKKLLFVLSDGIPTDYPGGYKTGVKDVHDAVKMARKNGVEVTAIYFGEDLSETDEDVKMFIKMYEKNYIISEPDDLINPLVRCIKRFCFK